jgi:phosphopantetheinyl transferase
MRPVRAVVRRLDEPIDGEPLSEPERERAGALRPLARRRFVRRRALLRRLLAAETRSDPRALVLESRCARCARMHPASPLRAGGEEVWWSASSSAELCLVVTASARVGADIEAVDPRRGWRSIAHGEYLPGEREIVGDDAARFFAFWTIKEAYLKALGVGLAGDLAALDCSRLEDHSPGWRSAALPGWLISTFVPLSGYVASVALDAGAARPCALALTLDLPTSRDHVT